MHIIKKDFEFDYGHRVWSQVLDPEFAQTNTCKCRHLHGHRGKIVIALMAEELNAQGMVTDFNHLNWFKKVLDDKFDHKFILHDMDPFFETLFSQMEVSAMREIIGCPKQNGLNYGLPSIDDPVPNGFMTEIMSSYVITNFNPTSENLAQFFFEMISAKMSELKVIVHSIEFFETPKSSSIYINPGIK